MASKKNIEEIGRYIFDSQDCLYLDANIWLSVYGPVAYKDWRSAIYSTALRDIRRNYSKIFIDIVVLSEFINRFARFEYDQLAPTVKPKKFKDFRKSPEFKPVAEEISINAKKMLKTSCQCHSCFDTVNIDTLLTEYETGTVDFNDQLIANTCKAHGLILVTHDFDFEDNSLRILTANKKLLT